MKVAVGSTNPVKIQATKLAFRAIFPGKIWEVEGIEVKSGVPDQPMSDEESVKGAINRAKRAIKVLRADYGVGLEGGLEKVGMRWFEGGWAVVIDKRGNIGVGPTVKAETPAKVMKLIKKGHELGTAADILFKKQNLKRAGGYFAEMTNDRLTRTSTFRDSIICALIRFLHPEVFK